MASSSMRNFSKILLLACLALVTGTTSAGGECTSEACLNKEDDENVELQLRPARDTPSGANHGPYPYDLVTCVGGEPALTTEAMSGDNYTTILNKYYEIFEGLDHTCEGMACPVAQVTGCILRIGGHDFMDVGGPSGWQQNLGGSDACIDMHDPDNAGLDTCLQEGHAYEGIYGPNGIYQDWCQQISLADWFVISAEAAMNYTRHLYKTENGQIDAGNVDFKSGFMYGRTTNKSCPNNALMPNASAGCEAVQKTYIRQMRLDWQLAAALSGVHTLGKAQVKNSGFDGWWSTNKQSRYFNNNYFVSLYMKGWIPELVTSSGKWQWGMANKNQDIARDGKQMMLDTDFCLAYSNETTRGGFDEILAGQNPFTCAWTIPNLSNEPRPSNYNGGFNWHVPILEGMDRYHGGKFCGEILTPAERNLPGGSSRGDRINQWNGWYADEYGNPPGNNRTGLYNFGNIRESCCAGCRNYNAACNESAEAAGFSTPPTQDTGLVTHPSGRAAFWVMEFINNEENWLSNFTTAWGIATTNGDCCRVGRLHTLD